MNTNKTILFFVAIWILAVITAVVGFYISWDHLPNLIDCIMSVTLLAPFALPKSFADTIGFTAMNSTKGMIPAAAIFWPIVIALHWLAQKTKSILVFLILGAIILLASYKWFVVGTGMMGL